MLSLAVLLSSRRRHTRYWRDWSSDVCSSDLRAVTPSRFGLQPPLTPWPPSPAFSPSGTGDAMTNHFPRIDDLVEPLLVDETGFERSLLQCQAIIICLMRDRRGLVVADYRAERGHQHQRASDRLLDPRAVQSRSLHGEAAEFVARVAEHPGRVEEVVDHDRAHRVELEIALAARESHGVVFTDHLDADHHHCFALGRIDLARHDRGAGLVLR